MIAHQLVPESDYKFSIDARAAIEKAVGEFDLPDAFLKRWLLATDKNRKAENIDEDFAKMVPDLKWQLIKEQIVKQFDIHVDDADLLALAKRVAASQFAQYGMTGVPMMFSNVMLRKCYRAKSLVRVLLTKLRSRRFKLPLRSL